MWKWHRSTGLANGRQVTFYPNLFSAYEPPRVVYFKTKDNDPVISLHFSPRFLFLGDVNGEIHVVDIKDLEFTEKEYFVDFKDLPEDGSRVQVRNKIFRIWTGESFLLGNYRFKTLLGGIRFVLNLKFSFLLPVVNYFLSFRITSILEHISVSISCRYGNGRLVGIQNWYHIVFWSAGV